MWGAGLSSRVTEWTYGGGGGGVSSGVTEWTYRGEGEQWGD